MKRIAYSAAIIVLVASTLGADAQNFSSYGVARMETMNGKTTVVVAGPENACPVTARALQGTGYGLVHVRGAEPPHVPGQRIHLIVSNSASGKARSARVLVTGLSSKGRMRGISTTGDRSDMSRTIIVTFAPEDAASVAADLVLPGFTSVSAVELQSIAYQDGAVWSIAKGETCRVTPDRMMLVASH